MFDGLLVVKWLSAKQLPVPPNQARSASPESGHHVVDDPVAVREPDGLSGYGTTHDAGEVVVEDPVVGDQVRRRRPRRGCRCPGRGAHRRSPASSPLLLS